MCHSADEAQTWARWVRSCHPRQSLSSSPACERHVHMHIVAGCTKPKIIQKNNSRGGSGVDDSRQNKSEGGPPLFCACLNLCICFGECRHFSSKRVFNSNCKVLFAILLLVPYNCVDYIPRVANIFFLNSFPSTTWNVFR